MEEWKDGILGLISPKGSPLPSYHPSNVPIFQSFIVSSPVGLRQKRLSVQVRSVDFQSI
jgi:hypothetical protein